MVTKQKKILKKNDILMNEESDPPKAVDHKSEHEMKKGALTVCLIFA